MSTAVVLFTRDLRVHDHPALAAACAAADRVVPLFVTDPDVRRAGFATPNRTAFLHESLADLRGALRERGGDLVLRDGDAARAAVAVAREVGAGAIHLSGDVSAFAARREAALREAAGTHGVEIVTHPGVTVVPPGRLRTGGGGPYHVFTPFWRAWSAARWRDALAAPPTIRLPNGIAVGRLPEVDRTECSPRLPAGGETAARAGLRSWTRSRLGRYEELHDDLAADGTSRVSPYLHLGCLSPLEVASRLRSRQGAAAFVRQLAWRDFHHETTARFPAIGRHDLRPRHDRWRHDPELLAAWREGRTGYPIVDAGMRQLLDEGWMHNRARLVTASFLTKTMYLDWRDGADHFLRWLVDGDLANNSANWQWVAGTGTDTRPNRVLNPLRQAERFDPHGHYVRRYVPELAGVEAPAIHCPWTLPDRERAALDYPDRVVDHEAGARAYRSRH